MPNVNYKPEMQDTSISFLSQKEIKINYLKENNKIKSEIVAALFNISYARSEKIRSEIINENIIRTTLILVRTKKE